MTDRWIFITGGAGGIGSALARQCAGAGFRPAIGYRSSAQSAATLAESLNGEAIPLDLLDSGQIDEAVNRLCGREVTAVILNASPPPLIGAFTDIPLGEWENQLRVSVLGHARLLSGLIQDLFRPTRSGTVVGVLSKAMEGANGLPVKQMASYVVAKFGLLALMNAAAAEYRWLRVEKVYPSFAETPMLGAFDKRFVEILREQGAISDPELIAGQILELIVKPR